VIDVRGTGSRINNNGDMSKLFNKVAIVTGDVALDATKDFVIDRFLVANTTHDSIDRH